MAETCALKINGISRNKADSDVAKAEWGLIGVICPQCSTRYYGYEENPPYVEAAEPCSIRKAVAYTRAAVRLRKPPPLSKEVVPDEVVMPVRRCEEHRRRVIEEPKNWAKAAQVRRSGRSRGRIT